MVDKCNPMQWIVAANLFINVFMERNLNFAYMCVCVFVLKPMVICLARCNKKKFVSATVAVVVIINFAGIVYVYLFT